jgi:choline transport protein
VIWRNSDRALAEELKDASRILPLSMMWTVVLNGVLGWIMLVTFCFCIGDVQTALETPTGYPFIQVAGLRLPFFRPHC